MSKKYTPEELRAFYFSKATNFANHKKTEGGTTSSSSPTPTTTTATKAKQQQQQDNNNNNTGRAATPSSDVAASMTPIVSDEQRQQHAATPTTNQRATSSAGSAVNLAKKNKTTTPAAAASHQKNNQESMMTATSQSALHQSANAVAPEYITFLRQQQDLVKLHHEIAATLNSALEVSEEHKSAHFTDADAAKQLLATAEQSTEWNWKSKFNAERLVEDAGLTVPADLLCHAEDLPKVVELQHQHQQLVKLRQDHCQSNREEHAHFALLLDNGIRRVDRLIAEYSASQSDSESVVRLSDNLLVQLDRVLSIPKLEKVLREINDCITVVSQKYKECQGVRDQALEDGAMDIAQMETYRLSDLGEELTNAHCERIRILTSVADENEVANTVRERFQKQAQDDAEAANTTNGNLKANCQSDLNNLYEVKRTVDENEKQLSDKWAADRAASDAKLQNLADRQNEAWSQIQSLIQQINQMESERHQEFKRRIEEKVKDETRRSEYSVFTSVADDYAATLDRTIKNCDVRIHSTKLMLDFLNSGFGTIQKDLETKKSELDAELFSSHKDHLNSFRSLLFTLGDLQYKKEKRVEEVSENIKSAYIQQELCSDSLNPQAKKFSDARKELLRVRDDLEIEVADIRERQQSALVQYAPTEAALNKAGFSHQHPMEELEERRLETRAKMVGYRAMSLGNVSSQPIRAELEALQKSFNASRTAMSVPRGAARAASAASPQQTLNNTAPM